MSADTEFVFDAVVGFLTSPIWNAPVLTFIEQNCLVFDPDAQNRDAYGEIHKQYKGMVETLLASLLKDFGITEEQFMQACKGGGNNPQFNGVNREIFEQMWAAEDFEVFKRLMLRKNIELQLQALHLIQQRNHVIPPSMTMGPGIPSSTPPPKGPSESVVDDEDAIMQEVLRKSQEEFESQQKCLKASDTELEKSIAHSTEEGARLIKEAKREQEELEKALKVSLETQSKVAAVAEQMRDEVKKESKKPVAKPEPAKASSKQTSLPALKPTKSAPKAEPTSAKQEKSPAPSNAAKPSTRERQGKSKVSSDDAAANWLSSAKAEASAASSSSSAPQSAQLTEEEIARRTEYLKQQRDKLLEMKKQQRQKRLTTYTEQQPKARPTSARAARQVTDGKQVESPASQPGQEDKEKKLAMRRALAECLKREVVDKN